MQFANHARHVSPMIAAESLRLIDLCASTRDASVRLRLRADATRQQLRETLIRYELRTIVAIRGGSDVNGQSVNAGGDRRRLLVRTIAAHCPIQPRLGPSAGATCMLCCGSILAGALQYDIDTGRGTIIVDEDCYISFVRDIVEGTPAAGDDDDRIER